MVLAFGLTSPSYATTAQLTLNSYYKFKVESRNTFGYSLTFSNEILVLAANVPDAPVALFNNAAVTAAGVIGLTWQAPTTNGGSQLIDY